MTNEQELRATMLQAILSQGIPLAQAITDAEAAVAYVMREKPSNERPARMKRGTARTNAMLDMWAEGYSDRQIADQFGITPGSASIAVQRARRAGDPRAVRRVALSDEELARRVAHGKALVQRRLGEAS